MRINKEKGGRVPSIHIPSQSQNLENLSTIYAEYVHLLVEMGGPAPGKPLSGLNREQDKAEGNWGFMLWKTGSPSVQHALR